MWDTPSGLYSLTAGERPNLVLNFEIQFYFSVEAEGERSEPLLRFALRICAHFCQKFGEAPKKNSLPDAAHDVKIALHVVNGG